MANAIDLRYAKNIAVGAQEARELWFEDDRIWPQYRDYSNIPFTIESYHSNNTISLTYVNELEDKTGYPTQVEADVWIDDATQSISVVVPMNVTTSLATINKGHKIRVLIHNNNLQNGEGVYCCFGSDYKFIAYGNIMSLYEDERPNARWYSLFANSLVKDVHNLVLPTIVKSSDYRMFCYMCDLLTAAPKLPATTLAGKCYFSMFQGCTSLTVAPQLPATTLAANCYQEMFNGCTSLTTAPSSIGTSTSVIYNATCYNMFNGCTSLTTAPQLPATTLAASCYSYMFTGCTSLTTAPELPATTLTDYCYHCMFQGCTSLINVPNLPATRCAQYCYSYMFQGCTSLTTVPSDLLPATTLGNNCYYQMFYGCTSLTTVPADLLPATTLTEKCYTAMFQNCTSLTNAPDLPATTLANDCYYYMFRGCKSLTNAPSILPAMTLFSRCYYEMFYGTAIEIAPVLPALSFAAKYNCYNGMFRACRQLKWVKALFTTTPNTSYTANWLNDLPNTSTQIFVKNENATWTDRGVHSIPTKWTVQTCAADDYSYPE